MDNNKNKEQEDDSFKKAVVLIAALLGMPHKTYQEVVDNPKDFEEINVRIHRDEGLLNKIEEKESIEQKDVAVPSVIGNVSKLMKVVTVGDGTVCAKCKEWQGKIVCVDGSDKNYPSLDDYLKSGAFHPRCRCALKELTTEEIQRKHVRNEIPLSKLVFN